MNHIIRNVWQRPAEGGPEIAHILRASACPEGLDVTRVRLPAGASSPLDAAVGHIVSPLRGAPTLEVDGAPYALELGVHAFVPAGRGAVVRARDGSEVLLVSGPSRGEELLIRDEAFLAAAAEGESALRWILTPQYLSRRIFLHHDRTLSSRSGLPVSWFRTTMFDVEGLPANADGEPVFKMSYNSRTEFNVCYDVGGDARVRFAEHPYDERAQAWGPWLPLDGDCTYHLREEPHMVQRNKHEVAVRAGHVTLFCLFDPAPTGVERHRPGEYSDYEPLADVLRTPAYEEHRRLVGRYDEMVDTLSRAKARGDAALEGSEAWGLYQRGREAQRAIEAALHRRLGDESRERARLLEPWLSGRGD